MKRRIALALAIVAALAAAAIIRPPRAGPALSIAAAEATSTVDLAQPGFPASPRAKSRGSERHRHPRRSKSHGRRYRRLPPPVDLNRASAAELARIPGVTPWLAQRIVAFRALVGPFETLDDLDDLDGMSASRLASLGRYVVVR